jgi:F0F1-type ATP synthase membrane subunit b/b'
MEVLAKLGFDWKVALANLVNFLIIYLLLRNVVFKKLGNAIRERREKIQAGLDDAEKAKTALIMADHEKEQILNDGHLKVKELLVEYQRSKVIKRQLSLELKHLKRFRGQHLDKKLGKNRITF